MKKIALFLSVVLILSIALTGCSWEITRNGEVIAKSEDAGKKDVKSDTENTKNTEEPSNEDSTAPVETETEKPTTPVNNNFASVEEQVIYDAKDIKITATELSKDDDNVSLGVIVENNSTKDINITATWIAVNDIVVYGYFMPEVPAGKKAVSAVQLPIYELNYFSITDIGTIAVGMNVYDKEYNTIDDAVLTIDTSYAGKVNQKFDFDGVEVLNNDNLRIVLQKTKDEYVSLGLTMIAYIENKTNQNIVVDFRDIVINDFAVTYYGSVMVPAHMSARNYGNFDETSLKGTGIKDFDSIDYKLNIYDADTYSTLFESNVLTVSFK